MPRLPQVVQVIMQDDIALGYWRALPPMRLSMTQARALLEYSASNPSGVTVGKMWRRHNGAFDHRFIAAGGKPRWVICRYEEAPEKIVKDGPDPDSWKHVAMCKIVTYRPVVRVKMGRHAYSAREME